MRGTRSLRQSAADCNHAHSPLARMTFDTCQASDLGVGSDPWTLAAAKTFLAARALIVLGLAGMVGPCGCWCHVPTPAAKASGAGHTSAPRPYLVLVRSSGLNKYTARSVWIPTTRSGSLNPWTRKRLSRADSSAQHPPRIERRRTRAPAGKTGASRAFRCIHIPEAIGALQTQAHDVAMDRGRKATARSGAIIDTPKCREPTNRFEAYCCPVPISLEPPAILRKISAKAISRVLSITYRHCARSPPRLAWRSHYRSASRCSNPLNQLNTLTLFGELTCASKT
jgi:hypothetical protein